VLILYRLGKCDDSLGIDGGDCEFFSETGGSGFGWGDAYAITNSPSH